MRRPEDEEMMPAEEPMPEGEVPAGEESTPAEEPQALGINQATPEEQAQYEHFVGKAMTLMYDPKVFPQLIELLRGGAGGEAGDEEGGMGPAYGLAAAAVKVIGRVGSAAAEAGDPVAPVVLFHAGTEVFNQLADISARSGIKDYSEDPDAAEAAYFKAIDDVIAMAKESGDVDEQSAAADMERLVEADREGLLAQLMTKLEENDGGAAPMPQGEQPPMRGGMGV